MEKVEKKSNNTVIAVVITILVMLVIGLGGFIGYDKLINKTDTESTTTKNESKECDCPEVVEEEKGKCPFTKLDSSYVLTDQDRDEIIEALDKLNAGFTKDKIIKESIKVVNHSENNYRLYLTIDMIPEPETNNSFGALAIKVNGKFQVLDAGSGYDSEELKSLDYYLNQICG